MTPKHTRIAWTRWRTQCTAPPRGTPAWTRRAHSRRSRWMCSSIFDLLLLLRTSTPCNTVGGFVVPLLIKRQLVNQFETCNAFSSFLLQSIAILTNWSQRPIQRQLLYICNYFLRWRYCCCLFIALSVLESLWQLQTRAAGKMHGSTFKASKQYIFVFFLSSFFCLRLSGILNKD